MSNELRRLKLILLHAELVVEDVKKAIAELEHHGHAESADTTPENPPPTNPHP